MGTPAALMTLGALLLLSLMCTGGASPDTYLWPKPKKIPMMETRQQSEINAFNNRLRGLTVTNPAHVGDGPNYVPPDTSAFGVKPEHYKNIVESLRKENSFEVAGKGNVAPASWSKKKPSPPDGSGSNEPDTRPQWEKDGGFATWFMPEEFTKPWDQDMNQQVHNQLILSQQYPAMTNGGPVVPYNQLEKVYSTMHGTPALVPELDQQPVKFM